jgi:hypothetical protein
VCQPHGSLIFHGLLPMQSRVLIAYGRMANSIFLRGSQRKRVWILVYCQTIPPPPPKGECLQCASVTLLRPAGRWRWDTEGERGQIGDEVHGADAVFAVGFGRKYWFLCSRTEFVFFFGDDHGGEAMVGRRDAYWASGGPTITNSLLLLLSVLWAAGSLVANQIALVLGRTMQSAGGR